MLIEIHRSTDRGDIITLREPVFDYFEGKMIRVPPGFRSDGASVPRLLWAVITPAIDPRTLHAAICHDYLYREQPPGWSRRAADRYFFCRCREDGLPLHACLKAYAGLRLFGGAAWREAAHDR